MRQPSPGRSGQVASVGGASGAGRSRSRVMSTSLVLVLFDGRSRTGPAGEASASRCRGRVRGPSGPVDRVEDMPRPDGRANDQLRPITITRNWQAYAEGSALVEFGATKV